MLIINEKLTRIIVVIIIMVIIIMIWFREVQEGSGLEFRTTA